MFYRFRRTLIFSGLVLFVSGTLFAQTPRNLNFGTWVSGTLRSGEEQWFSIRPSEPGYAVLETTGNTDTYLEAYDASRNLIAEDDDSGEDYNARLEIFVEGGKTYLFKLRAYGDESGSYRLLASFDPAPPDTERNTERSRAIALKPWETVPVAFRTSSESRWYRYDIANPNSLLIIETRGSLDTLLYVYDDRGNLIDEDDDSGEDYNARLLLRRGRGTVYIEVKAYGSSVGRTALYAEIWRRE